VLFVAKTPQLNWVSSFVFHPKKLVEEKENSFQIEIKYI